MPTDRAYFNVRTPRASVRRPSSENVREYRRKNVTAGIDTHRSDVSFGRTTESIRGGVDGDSRAREATKSLTSGEVKVSTRLTGQAVQTNDDRRLPWVQQKQFGESHRRTIVLLLLWPAALPLLGMSSDTVYIFVADSKLFLSPYFESDWRVSRGCSSVVIGYPEITSRSVVNTFD